MSSGHTLVRPQGRFSEGEAFLRMKTDLTSENTVRSCHLLDSCLAGGVCAESSAETRFPVRVCVQIRRLQPQLRGTLSHRLPFELPVKLPIELPCCTAWQALWDPAAYRVLFHEHPRTGAKWCAPVFLLHPHPAPDPGSTRNAAQCTPHATHYTVHYTVHATVLAGATRSSNHPLLTCACPGASTCDPR